MKKTAKFFTLTVFATGCMVSQSWAVDPVNQERMANESLAYFEQTGQIKSISNATRNPNYEFASTPMQRASARDDSYWNAVGSSHANITHSDLAPFQGAVLSPKGYVFRNN